MVNLMDREQPLQQTNATYWGKKTEEHIPTTRNVIKRMNVSTPIYL